MGLHVSACPHFPGTSTKLHGWRSMCMHSWSVFWEITYSSGVAAPRLPAHGSGCGCLHPCPPWGLSPGHPRCTAVCPCGLARDSPAAGSGDALPVLTAICMPSSAPGVSTPGHLLHPCCCVSETLTFQVLAPSRCEAEGISSQPACPFLTGASTGQTLSILGNPKLPPSPVRNHALGVKSNLPGLRSPGISHFSKSFILLCLCVSWS